MYTPFDPYVLLEQTGIKLYLRFLPDGLNGVYAARGTNRLILLNRRLNRVEMRCVLTEELAHHFLGHSENVFLKETYREKLGYDKWEYDAKVWATDRLLDTNALGEYVLQNKRISPDDLIEHFDITREVLLFKVRRLALNYREKSLFWSQLR